MSITDSPILYLKPGCPWCIEVVEFLDAQRISYRALNVLVDSAARAEMLKKSGQTKAPTLDWHGHVLADFGVAELIAFLRERGLSLPPA